MTTSFDRRALLVGGLAASAATVVPLGQAFAQRRGRVSANDKVQVGLIGCKGMGWSDLSAMCKRADVAPVALCDVDATVLAARGAELKKVSGRTPKLYDDYRRMLDDKSIDAVIIATPDHWHALQLVDPCPRARTFIAKSRSETPLPNAVPWSPPNSVTIVWSRLVSGNAATSTGQTRSRMFSPAASVGSERSRLGRTWDG